MGEQEKIAFGSKVRDKQTGFEGIVVSRHEYQYDAPQCGVRGLRLSQDGTPTLQYIETPRLEVIAGPAE